MSDYSEKNVDELQDELRSRDLKVSGSKDELVARLEADDADDGSAEAADDGSAEAADDGDTAPAESAADDGDTTDDEPPSSPDARQVVQEDGWSVQQGNWRKGSG